MYEGFSSGGFKEAFQSNIKSKQKKNVDVFEMSDRSVNGLPEYNYIEDIPTDERKSEPSNLIVNNASKVKFEKNPIENVEKNLEDPNINFVFNDGKDIWTKFYCSIYDSLMLDNTKNKYEIKEIVFTTKMNKKSKVLDIGSGTGHHVHMFNKKGIDAVGMDSSLEMVKKAQENYPDSKFYNSDVMHSYQFRKNEFTHALMMFMTVYYIRDKTAAFHNVYNWLKPGGYMVIHLVNRDKFDPRIEAADPLYKVNPQIFSKERITKSYVKFNDFQYKGEFVYNGGDQSKYVETLKEDDGNKAIRNEHKYYMETQKEIINKAKSVGFKLKGKINMDVCAYPYEYLYVFVKK
tara:strand:+ start:308 stop:1348 length:1041 start_codon:yes stop_codon:yes gene_type:complete